MYAASFFKRVVNIPRSLCLVAGGLMSGALYLGGVMTVNRISVPSIFCILNFLLIQVYLRSGTLIGLLLWFLQFFNSMCYLATCITS